MTYHAIHIGEERHDHQKHLSEAMTKINKAGGRITSVSHVAVDGAYDRLMVSTVIIYETGE